MVRKEAWPFYRTISGVRLCWELEEPQEPTGTRGSQNLCLRVRDQASASASKRIGLQGFLAHKKPPTPLGPQA